MRVHALRVTAFGPFAGRVEVDVDELSAQGLFLLTGPTGAGKTSVLDAICFGLYGQVPGARQQADRLRSDHADPGLAPEVRLDLTLGDRRLRVTRSPRWQRPSSRARSGFVTQQASVLLQERAGDDWSTLTTRIDEAQLVLDDLLGMTLGQFTQVALLPQGQFQEFLRAGADERRKLLERLFGTGRFRDVERWLVEHRAATRARVETAQQAACSAADQLHGAAHLHDSVPDDPADWPVWAEQVVTAARQRRDDLSVLVEQSRDVRDGARRAHDAGVQQAELRRRGEAAKQRLSELESTQPDADRMTATLRAADRAHEVTVLLEPLAAGTAQVSTAERAAAAALTDVHRLLPTLLDTLAKHLGDQLATVPSDRLAVWLAALEAERTSTDRAVEREQQLAAEVARLGRLDDEATAAGLAADEAERAAARLRTAATEAPATIIALRAAIDGDQRLDATHDHLAAAVERARKQADAAARLPAAERRLRSAETAAREAFDVYRRGVDTRIDIARRRLAGAAAEIASGLADGCPCPVCGSPDHPRPALSAADRVDEADEAAAALAEAAAGEARERADARVVGAGAEVAEIAAAADGLDPTMAESALAEVTEQLAAAAAARTRLPGAQAQLAAAEAAQSNAAQQLDTATQRARGLRAQADNQRAARSSLHASLVTALGEDLDVTAALQATERRGSAVGAALAAVSALLAARSSHATARGHADRLAHRHGFADAGAAQAAALDDTARHELRSGLAARDRQADADADVVADAAVAAAMAAAAPDLEGLAAAAEMAEATHEGQRADLVAAERTTARLDELHAALRTRFDAWQPAQDAHRVAAGLAALAEGKSGDNQQRMSLSSYVLAARLEQVVAAANERLVPMTSSRYTLEHTVDKAAGDRRAGAGGLGLLVRDEWTGDLRDPSTLSGGETFQASLALALGLADVVGHECGGTQLQTVFVDEGFGSLDADSLDEVLDELDRLRDGGRVVGVVSHVDAMRERIPTQLRLVKARTGSTVALAG